MKFLALAASGLTLALFAPAVQADTYLRLQDIVRYNDKPGVYIMSANMYRVDEQGREKPDSNHKWPLLVNCRDTTQAYYNVNTETLQIMPINRSDRVGKWCEDIYGWMGN